MKEHIKLILNICKGETFQNKLIRQYDLGYIRQQHSKDHIRQLMIT